jgi:predicted RNase H-like nuclease (RuvC/YqgF family)
VHGQQSSDTSYVSSEAFQERVTVFENKIDSLSNGVSKSERENDELRNKLQQAQAQLENLNSRLDEQQNAITQSNQKIDSLSQKSAQEIDSAQAEIAGLENETESQFSTVTSSFSESMWWIGGAILSVLILSVVGFMVVRGRATKEKEELDERFTKKNNQLESKISQLEQTNKSDTKLLEVLNEKLENMPSPSEQQEVDHSLALASSLEIIRMRKRIERMDADAKGLKSLSKALERLQDELEIKGYEIIDLEGQEYHDGMNVKANFVPDEELDEDESVIKRTIKPQVNYQGKAVQHEQIQVATGTKK